MFYSMQQQELASAVWLGISQNKNPYGHYAFISKNISFHFRGKYFYEEFHTHYFIFSILSNWEEVHEALGLSSLSVSAEVKIYKVSEYFFTKLPRFKLLFPMTPSKIVPTNGW